MEQLNDVVDIDEDPFQLFKALIKEDLCERIWFVIYNGKQMIKKYRQQEKYKRQ